MANPTAPHPDFPDDPRLHFSKETNTWRYEADDGTEMEWDTTKSGWVPVVRSGGQVAFTETHSQSS
jgi:hypothetical protein